MNKKFKYILINLLIIVLLGFSIVFLNYQEYIKERIEITNALENKDSNVSWLIYEEKTGLYSEREKERVNNNKEYNNNKIYILSYSNKDIVKYKGSSLIEVDESTHWDLVIYQLKVFMDIILILCSSVLIPLVVYLLNKLRGNFVNGNIVLSKKQVYDILIVSVSTTYITVKFVGVFVVNFNINIVYSTVVGVIYVLLTLVEESAINKKELVEYKKEKEELKTRRERREKLKEEKRANKEANKESKEVKAIDTNEKVEFDDLSDNELAEFAKGYNDYLNSVENETEVNKIKDIENYFNKKEDKSLLEIKEFFEKVKKGKIVLKDGKYIEKE